MVWVNEIDMSALLIFHAHRNGKQFVAVAAIGNPYGRLEPALAVSIKPAQSILPIILLCIFQTGQEPAEVVFSDGQINGKILE